MTMADLAVITGRVEIEAPRGEFTHDGWKFTGRASEIRYLDTTPLAVTAAGAGRA
jgi:hypothetical protein